MAFEILDAGDARWPGSVAKLPAELRDLHFLPEYGRIYRAAYGFAPFAALYREGEDFVLQTFVRRPLDSLPFLNNEPGYSDIANPYGYGGPLSNAWGLYPKFADAFARWCDEEDIASEFCSLHPLLAERQREIIGTLQSPQYQKDVVVVDLTKGEDELAKDLRKGHKSSIAAARRAGVRIEKVEADAGNLATFSAMYEKTMVRRHAAGRWFVPENYFRETFAQLGDGRASMFFAFVKDELESGCILMHDFGTAYYHYAATHSNYPELGANNLMVWEAAMWAKRAGHSRFHLGGGVSSSPDDSLLRFKAGFTSGRAPLYTYFTIRDRAVYDELSARKRAHERATLGAESTSDFVPVYRR